MIFASERGVNDGRVLNIYNASETDSTLTIKTTGFSANVALDLEGLALDGRKATLRVEEVMFLISFLLAYRLYSGNAMIMRAI